MSQLVRLAFLVPALLLVPSAGAQKAAPHPHKQPVRYVTLDKLIRKFAAEAQQKQQAAQLATMKTLIAQR